MNEWERVMARQHAGMTVISEGHKEAVNNRTAGAASKCSAGNATIIRIRIRPNSLKPLFGTSLVCLDVRPNRDPPHFRGPHTFYEISAAYQ